MTRCSPRGDDLTGWSRGDLRTDLVITLLAAVLFFPCPVAAEPADFRDLSTPERDAWLDHLGSVLGEASLPNRVVGRPEQPLEPGPWKQVRDSIKWRIGDDGLVVLDDGSRPMGSRIFARSCFLQHGDSFTRWAATYAQNLKIAHLVATAVTESGCSEAKGQGSVDNKSTGIMQVTGYTCRDLLRFLGRRDMTERACLTRMAAEPDFSVELAAAYITQPRQLKLHFLDPPKVAAAYNSGGIYFDARNPWRLRSTGNHIDRFVSAYNAYVAWQIDEKAGRRSRSPAVRLTRGASLPPAVASVAALNELTPKAQEGDIVFVGDLDTKEGDFYVLVDGAWRASLEDSET